MLAMLAARRTLAYRTLLHVACALALVACGGGGGGNASPTGNSNSAGNNSPPISIAASPSSVALRTVTRAGPHPYSIPFKILTITFSGSAVDVKDVPAWLQVSQEGRSNPATFNVMPDLDVAAGDYATTLHFTSTGADGVSVAAVDVPVTMHVDPGSAVQVHEVGLAADSTIVVSLDNGLGVTLQTGYSSTAGRAAVGSTFTLTVNRQAQNQRCTFADGETSRSAVALPDYSFATIYCNATLMPWAWMGGSQTDGAEPVYGVRGTASQTTTPGARQPGAFAADVHGNLWLFGGAASAGLRNDLWRYDIDAGTWTWISGSKEVDAPGVYGTHSVPASSNVPGARKGSVAWIDAHGDFWMFGGDGYNASARGYLNDVWKYDVDADTWTSMGGSASTSLYTGGTYGTTLSVNNLPGARTNASLVQDVHGDIWIFGGYGKGSTTLVSNGYLNDLWRHRPGSGEWEWMGGSDQPGDVAVSGTQGVADPANHPGARAAPAMWADTSGNVWLFGGVVIGDAVHTRGDLWRYDAGSKQWTWVGGPKEGQPAPGQYSTPGSSTTDIPPGRYGAATWMDAAGNFWLFGGSAPGETNDLWKYTPASNTWSWLSGSGPSSDKSVLFGTRGVASALNIPPHRLYPAAWRDASGRFWLYSGVESIDHYRSDLWRAEIQ